MKILIWLFCVLSVGCATHPLRSSPDPAPQHGNTAATQTIEQLCARLHQQGGNTMGYPFWDNTILYHGPAASILEARRGRHIEAISALKEKLSDYTVCDTCHHAGRGSRMGYTVSDVVCYILVDIHTAETLELVIDELKRRRASGRRGSAIVWALRNHHRGRTYAERPRRRFVPNKTSGGDVP